MPLFPVATYTNLQSVFEHIATQCVHSRAGGDHGHVLCGLTLASSDESARTFPTNHHVRVLCVLPWYFILSHAIIVVFGFFSLDRQVLGDVDFHFYNAWYDVEVFAKIMLQYRCEVDEPVRVFLSFFHAGMTSFFSFPASSLSSSSASRTFLETSVFAGDSQNSFPCLADALFFLTHSFAAIHSSIFTNYYDPIDARFAVMVVSKSSHRYYLLCLRWCCLPKKPVTATPSPTSKAQPLVLVVLTRSRSMKKFSSLQLLTFFFLVSNVVSLFLISISYFSRDKRLRRRLDAAR